MQTHHPDKKNPYRHQTSPAGRSPRRTPIRQGESHNDKLLAIIDTPAITVHARAALTLKSDMGSATKDSKKPE